MNKEHIYPSSPKIRITKETSPPPPIENKIAEIFTIYYSENCDEFYNPSERFQALPENTDIFWCCLSSLRKNI